MKLVKESINFKKQQNSHNALGVGILYQIHKEKEENHCEHWSDLVYCCYYDISDWVKYLLDNGYYVDEKNTSNTTPLLFAASQQHNNIVKLLLDAGADVNHKNDYNMTALKYAAGYEDLTNLLKSYGAKE